MFVLCLMKETVRVIPELFDRDEEDTLKFLLEEKYSNKVIIDIGLGISVFEIKEVLNRIIYPGDGAAHVTVLLNLLVFRPFIGEIINGTVHHIDEKGIKVSIGFFEDIIVEKYVLPNPSTFRKGATPSQSCWVWMFKAEDSEDVEELFIEKNQKVRFQVSAIKYTQIDVNVSGVTHTLISETSIPTPTKDEKKDPTSETGVIKRQRSTSITSVDGDSNNNIKSSPMEIQGNMLEAGLGAIAWWL